MSEVQISEFQGATWYHCADSETLAAAAAQLTITQLNAAIAQYGEAHLVVPGGRSPAALFAHLAAAALNWRQINLYPSDERCLPVGDGERNDVMIEALLLKPAAIPREQFHPMAAEQGATSAAAAYQQLLAATPPFSVALLGMGEDGHTASLFPQHLALTATSSAAAVFAAPKPPPERVTLTLPRLRASGCKIVLATGSAKHAVLRRIAAGERFPVTAVAPDYWITDIAKADLGA
ncbi:MAG: 6-phosphogluconolactonase [Gammaproteobacteria bacterium]|nr:6-phosphogluconolactonase [Gammaproteobacteria bacterium]